MTLNLELSPEREAELKTQARARGLTIEQWALQLLGQSGPRPASSGDDARPIWEILADSMKDLPPEDLAALPKDGASQIDHYVYGHPKR